MLPTVSWLGLRRRWPYVPLHPSQLVAPVPGQLVALCVQLVTVPAQLVTVPIQQSDVPSQLVVTSQPTSG